MKIFCLSYLKYRQYEHSYITDVNSIKSDYYGNINYTSFNVFIKLNIKMIRFSEFSLQKEEIYFIYTHTHTHTHTHNRVFPLVLYFNNKLKSFVKWVSTC